MRGAGDDGDLLAFDEVRQDVADRTVVARHETCRRAVIGIGEVGALARLDGRRDRGDHGIAAVVLERIEQEVEAPRLDRAGGLDLVAQQPRQIDVEAGGVAVRPGIIERRIIHFGEEADRLDARQIRTLRPPPRIPETGNGGALQRRRTARRDRVCARRAGPSRPAHRAFRRRQVPTETRRQLARQTAPRSARG